MHLLHIVSTYPGVSSSAVRVSDAFVEAMHDKYDDLTVTTLDLFSMDLPVAANSNIESKYLLKTSQALDTDRVTSWNQIEVFLSADIYLLTVSLWNLGIPRTLMSYIDAIVQPGHRVDDNEQGIQHGLVKGKRMVCVTSQGNDIFNSPMPQYDFVENFLPTAFGFLGITDMYFINAQPIDVSLEMRYESDKKAIHEACELVRSLDWRLQSGAPRSSNSAGLKPAPNTKWNHTSTEGSGLVRAKL